MDGDGMFHTLLLLFRRNDRSHFGEIGSGSLDSLLEPGGAQELAIFAQSALEPGTGFRIM